MQFRLIPAVCVFLGSYFPLTLILLLQDIPPDTWKAPMCVSFNECSWPTLAHPTLAIVSTVATGLCLLITLKILAELRYKYPVEIIEYRPIPSELISYSFPYIVSFMGVDYGSAGKIAGLLTFLAWLFLITYRSGQIVMNPILLVLGWGLYEAKIRVNGHERIVKLLSKQCPTPGMYKCQEVQGSYITDGNNSI